MRKLVTLLYSIIWATSLFISVGSVSTVMSAELRPLNLPSTQRQYSMPAPAQKATPTPSVYDRFATLVEGLNDTQKEEYRSSYQASLADARSRRDKAAETYYQTLLDILK
jgi:hypothetical protein